MVFEPGIDPIVIRHSWTALKMKAGDISETLESVYTGLRDVISQETGIFIGTVVRISNLTKLQQFRLEPSVVILYVFGWNVIYGVIVPLNYF